MPLRKLKKKTRSVYKTPLKNKAKNKSVPKGEPSARLFPIVGVGASAGGLKSFTQLLTSLPSNPGFAMVFIQHLEPIHESLSTEILSHTTDLPVTEIKSGELAVINHVYIMPSDFDLEIKEAVFKLSPREVSLKPHNPIDTFFASLALDQGNLSMGVVLSGMGSDGTEGLKHIWSEGGIAFAQTPESTPYDSMPKSAVEAGVVDFILSPEAIANELVQTASQIFNKNKDKQRTVPNPDASHLDSSQKIIELLSDQTQMDFTDYKQTTLLRRVARRMLVLKRTSETDYVDFLQNHPEEIKILFAECLIHVTSFYRDPQAFLALENKVFPEILKNHSSETTLRIWVPGCSTGEEAYSILFSLLDYMESTDKHVPIQIFASDISEVTVQKARQGLFSEASVRPLAKATLQKYFIKSEAGYRVNKRFREFCIFSKHDLTSDPPFAKVDLISCRNLLIYFSQTLQKRALPLFHYALNENGFLFLGHSESVGSFTNLFETLDKTNRIFQKKSAKQFPKFQFSINKKLLQEQKSLRGKDVTPTTSLDLQREADRIVSAKYGPCGVVVNDSLEVLQFRGRTVPYLEQTSGLATLRLLKLAHPSLAFRLRSVFQAAKKKGAAVRTESILFEFEKKSEYINIEVFPMNPSHLPADRQYLVLIEKALERFPAADLKLLKKNLKGSKAIVPLVMAENRIKQLEQQITSNHEYQQTLSEDHEAAQEEISSTNEELQSSNEELQSTNEELETAKEEIQSTNEEITTVNDELQTRNSQLGSLNDDLNNLFASIDIPILIVGADLCIRRLTPTVTKYFGITAADIGRKINSVQNNLNIKHLDYLLSQVTENLSIKELEVQDHNLRWYKLQIRPYRTTDNRMDGLVLSFVDIESMKLAMGKLEVALEYATSISEALQIPSIIMNRKLEIKSVNALFCQIFDIPAKNVEGRLLTELGNKNWNVTELKSRLEDTILQKKPFQDFEVSGDFKGIGQRTFLLNARQILWADLPEPESILLTLMDITERKKIEVERGMLLAREQEARLEAEKANRAKDLFMATLSHELRTPLSSIITWAQLIRSGKVDFEKAKSGALVIERSAKTQSQLIDDLLDFSRIVAGKLAIEIQKVDPAEIIPLAVDSVLSLAEKRSIKIETRIEASSGHILANSVRLQQIVWNLLTNSIKFSPKGTQIKVELDYLQKNSRRFVRIQVRDQGKGIPPEFLPHIFNQFSQADSSSTRVHGGLGLGLSIVHNLVELQGGTIEAQNLNPGPGALFTIMFPLTDENSAVVHSEFSNEAASITDHDLIFDEQPSLEGIRILVVDDDDSTREALTIYLRSFGAKVGTANSASSALKKFSSFKPHVLLSDIAMPEEDGYSLLKKIRAMDVDENPDVPAIALTAFASPLDVQRALDAGFQTHFAKPVETRELISAIIKLKKN
jgi:two-component system CheB/CheR fusion protein